MSERLSVTVLPDGPLKLSDAQRVSFCGNSLPIEGEVYLCRCGESANAPFCDGTHSRVGFSGDNDNQEQKEIRVWEGIGLRTFFNPNICMHALDCKPLGALRERELAGDADAGGEIMRVVGTCPSGALTFEAKTHGSQTQTADPMTQVEILEGGEVRLQCDFEINVPLNEKQREGRATLCRCGLSKNKPWCDGRHKSKADFR